MNYCRRPGPGRAGEGRAGTGWFWWKRGRSRRALRVVQAVEENGEGQAKPAEVGYFSRQSGEAAKIRPAAAHWRRGHFHANPWENVYACPIRARFSTFPTAPASPRSAEHTSELQSLMRTSY